MFKKNKPSEKESIEAAADQAFEDFIVHNMPAPASFGGPLVGASKPTSGLSGSLTGTNNFKLTGLIIMGSGLVFIGLIVYGSYRFMIKPLAAPQAPVAGPAVEASVPSAADQTAATTTAPAVSGPEASSTILAANLATEVAPATAEQVVATTSQEAAVTELTVAPDSDADGLSDPEESVFGTDPLSADSDKDGYEDANEISSGYNPLGAGKQENILAKYENAVFGYGLQYPASWSQQALGGDSTAIFTAPDESIIQVVAQENSDRLSIMDWYQASFPDEEISYDDLKSGAGWEGVASRDGLNLYLTDQLRGRVLIVSYIAADKQFNYPFILSAVVKSLLLR